MLSLPYTNDVSLKVTVHSFNLLFLHIKMKISNTIWFTTLFWWLTINNWHIIMLMFIELNIVLCKRMSILKHVKKIQNPEKISVIDKLSLKTS